LTSLSLAARVGTRCRARGKFVISALCAGAGYFAIVVACGSVLGAIRIGLLAPRIGDLAAVVVELPVILAISWFVCGALIERFAVPRRPGARFAMGGLAFALLMTAEARCRACSDASCRRLPPDWCLRRARPDWLARSSLPRFPCLCRGHGLPEAIVQAPHAGAIIRPGQCSVSIIVILGTGRLGTLYFEPVSALLLPPRSGNAPR
jgi:hypothetical protein